MALVVGVDGTVRGWVFVLLGDGRFERAELYSTFALGMSAHPDAEALGVDIPIGLPERGKRPADVQARTLLRSRASTIFITPPRAVLDAPTYAEANHLCRELSGQGLTRQAFALFPKIRDVEAAADRRVFEVHPEVSFARLAGAPLAARKRTWAGAMQRRALLAGAGIVLPDDLGAVGHLAPTDDILDAAVVAWTAARIAARTAVSLPDGASPGDAAIWA
jgi:predicted RNase H-like nuclease